MINFDRGFQYKPSILGPTPILGNTLMSFFWVVLFSTLTCKEVKPNDGVENPPHSPLFFGDFLGRMGGHDMNLAKSV